MDGLGRKEAKEQHHDCGAEGIRGDVTIRRTYGKRYGNDSGAPRAVPLISES